MSFKDQVKVMRIRLVRNFSRKSSIHSPTVALRPKNTMEQNCKKYGGLINIPSKLNIHKRCHSGIQPSSCKKCKKPFLVDGDLERQYGEKQHACFACNKTFNDKSNLKRHIRTHTGEKPFVCKNCKMRFSLSFSLDSHIRTHNGVKPYACTQCNKSFSQDAHLKEHDKTHSGEKPFICTTCGQSFSQLGDLNRHQMLHTGEKPFVCNRCDQSFSRYSNLKRHQLQHSIETPANGGKQN